MFRRLSNSWELTKASANVLSADKELMVFPLISAVMLVLVSAGFIAPFVLLADKGKDVEAIGKVDTRICGGPDMLDA